MDLLSAGVVDHVVPECPDAAEEPAAFCLRMGHVLQHELVRLLRAGPGDR